MLIIAQRAQRSGQCTSMWSPKARVTGVEGGGAMQGSSTTKRMVIGPGSSGYTAWNPLLARIGQTAPHARRGHGRGSPELGAEAAWRMWEDLAATCCRVSRWILDCHILSAQERNLRARIRSAQNLQRRRKHQARTDLRCRHRLSRQSNGNMLRDQTLWDTRRQQRTDLITDHRAAKKTERPGSGGSAAVHCSVS